MCLTCNPRAQRSQERPVDRFLLTPHCLETTGLLGNEVEVASAQPLEPREMKLTTSQDSSKLLGDASANPTSLKQFEIRVVV